MKETRASLNIEFHSKKHKKNKIVNGKTAERDCVNDFSKLAWRFLKRKYLLLTPSMVCGPDPRVLESYNDHGK